MSDLFRIRLATPADAETIAWHRARMFQDMGEVPPNLFETFRANREIAFMMRSRVVNMSAGWLAPRMIQISSLAVPAFICTELCRTLSVGPLSPRVASVSSLMYLPRRNGEDKVSPGCYFDESSNGREQNAWIALSFTLRKKAERSTNDSDSSQAMRCDWRAISFIAPRVSLRP